MTKSSPHQFHIPVMGIGFTIDTPVKVARFGINSALSIVVDDLLEEMRKFYCEKWNLPYHAITKHHDDCRAHRITEYLNTLDYILGQQMQALKNEAFEEGTELSKYFEMLPDDTGLKADYLEMLKLSGVEREQAESRLRDEVVPGTIEVNIMTKVDKPKLDKDGNEMAPIFSDALSALRGFGNSNFQASVIFSAGLNPRLYGYCEQFQDFYPDQNDLLKKKIILKVSDYRSALIQGKFLAKKGLWISEFRIESGLNCGGHAFATEGLLMGPILEEFKQKRNELSDSLYEMCQAALTAAGKTPFAGMPEMKITAQGGIGTSAENKFLLEYYELNRTGWGSPFLLVPEATNVDDDTLENLSTASPEDFFLSHASPLGVPFNNFRKSSSEVQRLERIAKGKPGSPCLKKFLQFDKEFTTEPICTASTKYQYFKLKQLRTADMTDEAFDAQVALIQEKDCLCEGLSAPALLVNQIPRTDISDAVTICPGPNLAFFSGVFTLRQMIDHIYGRTNLLNQVPRPNLFVNELKLYVQYLRNESQNIPQQLVQKKQEYLNKFRENLLIGIDYYKQLAEKMEEANKELFNGMMNELLHIEASLVPIYLEVIPV